MPPAETFRSKKKLTMQTIEIKIIRTGSFMSRNMPYEVWFKQHKLGRILKESDCTFTIPREKGVLKLREFGSKFAFHVIQKEIVIFPENIAPDNNKIECNVTATLNWMGALTMGLLAPIRKIDIEIKY